MKHRVLITGASGFVGYHLIVEALNNDLEVFAAIRKSSKTDHLQNLGIHFTYLDYENPEELAANFAENQYHYVIHAAGTLRARTANEYNHINADYTYNLAKAAAGSKSVKKFVMISSLAGIGPLDDIDGVLTEASEPHPITAYGKSKILAEERLRSIPGLNYTILRPTAVYGPRDKDIFIFLKQVAKGFEPYIGKIEQKLTFIYVSDLAVVAIKALRTGDGETYSISDGNVYSRYELADLTKEILNVKTYKIHIPVTFVIMIAKIAEKIGSLSNQAPVINTEKLNELKAVNWSCSIDKAKRELGFLPAHDLRAGLSAAFSWYKNNNWL